MEGNRDFDWRCINTIRVFSADVVQKANSGHPGAPMGMAPMAHLVWSKNLNFSPKNPKWLNRDRFVLSNGHACALLYTMLHLTGFEEFSMDEMKRFRQLGSKTPGHPENHMANGGVEVSTGPLGQGISNAVGLAIAQEQLAAVYNKSDFPLFTNRTWVFCGDGCLMEGVSGEAGSLAGHLGLQNLIVLYDDNHISIDGSTNLAFTEDVAKRYEAYGWRVIIVEDGNNNLEALEAAIEEAKIPCGKPTMIKVQTIIGFGSSQQGSHKVHGTPLGKEDLSGVKKKFGFDPEKSFIIPEEVQAYYTNVKNRGAELEAQWNAMFEKYSQAYPDLANEIKRRFTNKLPENWMSVLPKYKPEDAPKATRQFSQVVINALSKVIPELVGGSADLNPSTLTYLDISKDFQQDSREGRNIRFGVREHAMSAVCNGLSAYGGFVPYCSTFLNFIGYAMGAVRLSAISHFGVLYIMTHDSIGLGEDGPTHQPINSLMMIRAMPNILLLRPADGNEVSGAYAVAIQERHRPSVISLTRQNVPNLKGSSMEAVFKGAYVLSDPEGGKPQLAFVASGSEVSICVEAAKILKDLRVRVISMPSWELFREQSVEYQQSVFLDGVPVLAVEAASATGWREYAHAVWGMTTFGASGPYQEVYKHFGFTPENIAQKGQQLVEFYTKVPPHNLIARPW